MAWRVAFITGGGSGIGRRIAEMLLAEGCKVAVFDRSGADAARPSLELLAKRHHTDIGIWRADVCDSGQLAEAIAEASARLGPPDLALNCAGIQDAQPFLAQSAEAFERVVSVNLLGSRNFAAAALPHMERGSQLALMASLAGLVPSYSYSAYNASKFGVVGLAGALRLDCVERGISVNTICPPEVETPMVVEERKTMSITGARLKGTAGTLQLEPACRSIVNQLKRNRSMVIPGVRARGVALVARWFPGLMRWTSERIVLATLPDKENR
ncbi:MAG: SDR family NAD(P)-dependent oxidoreductase [Pseudomonadota bacterium]